MNAKHLRKRICLLIPLLPAVLMASGCGTQRSELPNAYSVYGTTSEYILNEQENSALSLEKTDMFASDLCVGGTENTEDSPSSAEHAETAAVFVIDDGEITYAKDIYEKRYPASTTKILTAYLALKYGDLDQTVTVSETAMQGLGEDSSLCHIHTGDQLTLRDLLYGLLLVSGNDAANVIAETISGSKDDFVDLMNREAAELGCTGSHFTNAHGLPDSEHYTTAYDLYLIFQEAVKNEEFVNIISTESYTVSYLNSAGEETEEQWVNTNGYLSGTYAVPDGVTVIGGKTGTTDSAGSCLALYSTNLSGSPVISIVLKGDSHEDLYACMSDILAYYAN